MWLRYVLSLAFLCHQARGQALAPDDGGGTPSKSVWYWCGLLKLSDARLWEMAISRQIGEHCWIDITPSATLTDCEFRVKGRPSLLVGGYDGIPQTRGGLGSGCVFDFDPSTNDNMSCQFYDTEYPLTQEERDAMCTDSIVANAAEQLRYGIRHGYCTDDPDDRCNLGEDDEEEEEEKEDPYIVGPMVGEQLMEITTLSSTTIQPTAREENPTAMEEYLTMMPSTTMQPTEQQDLSSFEANLSLEPTTLQPTEEQDSSASLGPLTLLSMEPSTLHPTTELDSYSSSSSLEQLALSLEPTTLHPSQEPNATTMQPTNEEEQDLLVSTLNPSHNSLEPIETLQPTEDQDNPSSLVDFIPSLESNLTLPPPNDNEENPSAFEIPLNLKPINTTAAQPTTVDDDLSANEVDFSAELASGGAQQQSTLSANEEDASTLDTVLGKEGGNDDGNADALTVMRQTKWAPFTKAERLEFFPNRKPPTFPSDANATRVVSAFQSAVVYDLMPRTDDLGVSNSLVDDIGSKWVNTTVVDANESLPFWERTAFFHAVLSDDGNHMVGGRSRVDFNFIPFTSHVEVYSFNGTAWQEKYVLPSFYEQQPENTTGSEGGNATREVIIGFTNGNSVATSFDGSVIAFLVHVMNWTADNGWTYANTGGVRVHSWNGTDYVQLGETVLVEDNITTAENPGKIPLLDDDGIGNFQMDPTGRSIFLDGQLYELGHDDSSAPSGKPPQWALAQTNLNTISSSARLSPDFTRLATQGPGDELVSIYQRSRQTGQWDRIAVIEAPHRRRLNDTSFGASFAWSEDGKTLAIGAPSQGRPPLDSAVAKQERTSGAVYVFQEYICTTRCTFVQVGDVPCRGEQCGEIIHISSDGRRVLFSFQEGDPMRVYFASYARVAPSSSFGVTEYVQKAAAYAQQKTLSYTEKEKKEKTGLRATGSLTTETGSGSQVTERQPGSKTAESDFAEALRDIEINEGTNDRTSAACAIGQLQSILLKASVLVLAWVI